MTPVEPVLVRDVIVPAVMGAGLLLSLVTLARDELERWRGHAGYDRRIQLHARAAAVAATGGTAVARRDHEGLRGRRSAVAMAVVLLAFAGYLIPGATWNFFNPVEHFRQWAWLWAICMAVVVAALSLGIGFAVAARRWADLPAPVRPLLTATRLTAVPTRPAATAGRPALGSGLARASGLGLLAFLALSAFVAWGSPLTVDRALADAVWQVHVLGNLRWLNPFAETETAIAASALVGVATWRCPPLAIAYVGSVMAAAGLSVGINTLVDRPRPPGWTGEMASFPSGHITTAALMTGLLPLALWTLSRNDGVRRLAAAVLGVGLLGVVVHRWQLGAHWPLDAVGSLLVATACVCAVLAWLRAPERHARCRRCPWQADVSSGRSP